MMFSLNMVDYPISFLSLSTWTRLFTLRDLLWALNAPSLFPFGFDLRLDLDFGLGLANTTATTHSL